MGAIDTKLEPVLNDAEFRMFTELLRRHCGLHFGPESRFVLEKRLARRLRELEIKSFASYHYLLRNARPGDDEFAKLIDELTTNETYFLRERSQLRALVSEIFSELRLQRRARARGSDQRVVGRLLERRGALQHRDAGARGRHRSQAGSARLRLRHLAQDAPEGAPGRVSRVLLPRDRAADSRASTSRRRTACGASRTPSSSTWTSSI